MRVPIASDAPTPIASPIAQPCMVSPTADHRVDADARPRSAAAVCDMEGNSSLRMTPAALSPCQRPSAAARTASRSPYLRA
jgi:hypothetical protein